MKTILRKDSASSKSWRSLVVPLLAGGLLFLGACATEIVKQTTAFNEADFQAYARTGSATIQGNAFARSDTGRKHGAAGIMIYLVPLTPYTEERAKIMESGKEPAPADPELAKFVKSMVGNFYGAFAFQNLPAGKYLVYSKVSWEPVFATSRARDASGDVWVVARTEVTDGQVAQVVASNVAIPKSAAQ